MQDKEQELGMEASEIKSWYYEFEKLNLTRRLNEVPIGSYYVFPKPGSYSREGRVDFPWASQKVSNIEVIEVLKTKIKYIQNGFRRSALKSEIGHIYVVDDDKVDELNSIIEISKNTKELYWRAKQLPEKILVNGAIAIDRLSIEQAITFVSLFEQLD